MATWCSNLQSRPRYQPVQPGTDSDEWNSIFIWEEWEDQIWRSDRVYWPVRPGSQIVRFSFRLNISWWDSWAGSVLAQLHSINPSKISGLHFPQVACPDSLYESFLAPGSGRCLGVGSLSQHHVVMASTLTNQFAAIKFSEIKSNTKCKLDINMPIICLLKSCILYVLFYMLDLNWHILVSVRNKEKSYLAIWI